jgi:hypothetical protein
VALVIAEPAEQALQLKLAHEIDAIVTKRYRELGGREKGIQYNFLLTEVISGYGYRGEEAIRTMRSLVAKVAAERRRKTKENKKMWWRK